MYKESPPTLESQPGWKKLSNNTNWRKQVGRGGGLFPTLARLCYPPLIRCRHIDLLSSASIASHSLSLVRMGGKKKS